jgi:hypothetical protein
MGEEILPGGRTTGAVLIGGVVHKPASAWTPTVHSLLRHLEAAGFPDAPRALGIDEQGREMLTYVPGEVIGDRWPWPDWVYTESTLVQVGEWLRRLHDHTAGFVPPGEEIWFTGTTMRPGWVVGHQDASPYNAVMDGDRLVGFIDWDIASPSPREFDLAFSLLLWVPLASEKQDRDRTHLLLDSYGYEGDRGVFATVIPDRARRQAGVIRRMAENGDPVGVNLMFFADQLARAADDVEALPAHFWT